MARCYYDSLSAITNDPDAVQWTKVFILKHGTGGAVANISVMECESHEPTWQQASWLMINGKTYQLLQWGKTAPKLSGLTNRCSQQPPPLRFRRRDDI